jgi:hypothetical protein
MLNGGQPEQASGPNYDRALLQVDAMLDSLIAVKRSADVEREADRMWRDEQQAVVAAGGNADSLAVVTPSAAQDGVHPSPPAAPAVPPQRRESDVEHMNRINDENRAKIPQHYLKQDEPWRNHIGAGGEIIAPYFVPHG